MDQSFLEPERIVKSFNLKPGDHVADFGAGHGYFVIPMARIVGGEGRVYALDIQKSVLDIIQTKVKLEHLLNVECIWADVERPTGTAIKDRFLDFVLMANILFQAEAKSVLFEEAYRLLREGARLAVVEWDESQTSLGPPLSLRVKKEETKALAVSAGFTLDREFEAGSNHFGLLFIKK